MTECIFMALFKTPVSFLIFIIVICLILSRSILNELAGDIDIIGLICIREKDEDFSLCYTTSFSDIFSTISIILIICAEYNYNVKFTLKLQRRLALFSCCIASIAFAANVWNFLYNGMVLVISVIYGTRVIKYLCGIFLIAMQIMFWVVIHNIEIRRLELGLIQFTENRKQSTMLPLVEFQES